MWVRVAVLIAIVAALIACVAIVLGHLTVFCVAVSVMALPLLIEEIRDRLRATSRR